MEMLIGLAIGTALLYFWLIGHWFARVLVFLGLAGLSSFAGLIVGATSSNAAAGITIGLIGILVAWGLAAIPTFYWRRLMQRVLQQDAAIEAMVLNKPRWP